MTSFSQNSCAPSKLLNIEIEQLFDEGKDVLNFKSEILSISNMLDIKNIEREKLATELFLKLQNTPVSNNYSYTEPSDLLGIISSNNNRIELGFSLLNTNRDYLFDKLYGGILGKCIGCLLGKPIEGWTQHKIISFLQETNNLPIKNYLFDSMSDHDYIKYQIQKSVYFPITGMPEDDDINYILIAFKIIKEFGINFTPAEVAKTWINSLPIHRLCTGERIAYRNFVNGIYPPESATFCNPYREWIGAQIRADFFGYICPGNPNLAMKLAWKDASISHMKNGIYGALWVSVIISLIPSNKSFEYIICQSLGFIPKKSRFYTAISNVLYWYKEKISVENAFSKVHEKFSEKKIHDWCHVLPNAMIVAISLLWGNNSFLPSLQIALTAGFDTDSNGATVGSILGYSIGAQNIPAYWKNMLQNRIYSPVAGMAITLISDLASEALNFIELSSVGIR